MNSQNMSNSSSKQSTLDSYFKVKAANVMKSPTQKVKRRRLSLIKLRTPSKSPKLCDAKTSDVINLCSDEEVFAETTPKSQVCKSIDLSQRSTDSEDFTDCSQNTIIYSPMQSPVTPQKKNGAVTLPHHAVIVKTEPSCTQSLEKIKNNTNTQQHITPVTCSRSGPMYRSPKTREKFFSPTKKRAVVNRSANKVKRSLSMEMTRSMEITKSMPSRILFEDDLFAAACEGMDDKTKLLLQTINNYLNTPTIRHLLSEEEHKFLTKCLQVVKPGMRLVCRLYWRKDGWYKKETAALICSENKETIIDDPSFYEMMQSLIEIGVIVQGGTSNMTLDDFVAILKREELKQICKELKLQMNSKQNAVEALKNFSRRSSNISHFLKGYTSCNSDRVLKIMSTKAGACYKLSELARNTIYKLYIIMYLGMDYAIIREKKLELMLLYDKINRETYPVDKNMELEDASIVFRTRDEFERYLTAHNIYEDYLTRTELSDKCTVVRQVYSLYKAISDEEFASYTTLPKWLYRYTAPNIYVKILESGIQELKREKLNSSYSLASEILTTLIGQDRFRQHKKADWYAEQALILHTYLCEYDEAAKVLLEGFNSNLLEEEKDSMRERAKKIAHQKNAPLSEHLKKDLLEFCHKESLLEKNIEAKHVHKLPMDRVNKRGKVQFEMRTLNGGRLFAHAEEFCIGHYLYTGEFTHGEHWEGRIVNTLFFCLFWDIIYSKPAGVRGVFLSRYQQYPLDFFTNSFYENRQQTIDDWLYAIELSSTEKLLQIMEDTWKSRPEYELSGLSRGAVRWESARAVAACLGGAGLAAVCRRLALRPRHASGFPDLTLWHESTHKIKFVEVKTDSDKPSTKQKQWMHYLQSHGIDTEFCYVGAHTTRQRARKSIGTIKSEVKLEHEP